jgi:uncharacterized SAM-binding protein YcdF (DUF218 family)
MSRRIRRALVIGAAIVLVLVLGFAGLTARLFFWPPSSHPRHVDAVVMLSGDFGGRLVEARRLLAKHVSAVFVHAGGRDALQYAQICPVQASYEAICLTPTPDNTRTEARAVSELAKRRGWHDIAVVTSSYHVTRAGVLFRRCFAGRVQMVVAKERFGWRFRVRQAVHEWPSLVYAETLDRGC